MKNIVNFAAEITADPQKIDLLKRETSLFLETMEEHWKELLSERSAQALTATDLEQYFRGKERSDQVRRTLQYLLAFLTHIPIQAEIETAPVNPAEQFREFIRYQVDLLLEEDVKKAVLREINQVGSINEGNVWDYQKRIIDQNRELRELAAQNGGSIAQTIASLCHVLERLSLFWLQIRHGDLHRTRRSDLYVYSLSRIIINRCQQTCDV